MRSVTRTLVTAAAALTVSLGVLTFAAPAHADTSWGYSVAPGSHR